ncbi:hypothetical protein TorRG33x02_273380 [Trema orientale]|uniref:Uncharacterized protein n=1 Tax=Trema orientale TaxID=63057 RepID=A0A2P5CTN9_TREOI|nr:hypothetical protein TorRG33x02_273380 [Trema orientale]
MLHDNKRKIPENPVISINLSIPNNQTPLFKNLSKEEIKIGILPTEMPPINRVGEKNIKLDELCTNNNNKSTKNGIFRPYILWLPPPSIFLWFKYLNDLLNCRYSHVVLQRLSFHFHGVLSPSFPIQQPFLPHS